LKKFDSDDMLLVPLAKSAIGDCYVELSNFDKAISAYESALSANKNDFTTPTIKLKLALAYEAKGDVNKALSILEEAKADYPNNAEVATIEKTIARLNQ